MELNPHVFIVLLKIISYSLGARKKRQLLEKKLNVNTKFLIAVVAIKPDEIMPDYEILINLKTSFE